jgi:hypothetical protein
MTVLASRLGEPDVPTPERIIEAPHVVAKLELARNI